MTDDDEHFLHVSILLSRFKARKHQPVSPPILAPHFAITDWIMALSTPAQRQLSPNFASCYSRRHAFGERNEIPLEKKNEINCRGVVGDPKAQPYAVTDDKGNCHISISTTGAVLGGVCPIKQEIDFVLTCAPSRTLR